MHQFSCREASCRRSVWLSPTKVSLGCVVGSIARQAVHLSSLRPSLATRSVGEYQWIDGCEKLDRYKVGGYHPILINDKLHGRFTIVDKLGHGGYSTVWVARDDHEGQLVAVKVGVSRPSAAHRESEVLRALSSPPTSGTRVIQEPVQSNCVVPCIFDDFVVDGPNGTHPSYAMELMVGDLRTSSFSRLFPINVARALAARLVLAVNHIHSRGYVHGDIRLRNLLIRARPEIRELSITQFRERFDAAELVPVTRIDGRSLPLGVPDQVVLPLILGKQAEDFDLDDAKRLVLCDFGEAFAPAQEQRFGIDCHAPASKRAPEAAFEPNQQLSFPSDIWSLGVAIWEILGMKAIFTESEGQDEVSAEHIDVLGSDSFPSSWRRSWERTEELVADCSLVTPQRPRLKRDSWPPLEEAFELFVQKYRREGKPDEAFSPEETRAILNLMRAMLRFRPEERLTTQEILKSEWMVEWALPELSSAS